MLIFFMLHQNEIRFLAIIAIILIIIAIAKKKKKIKVLDEMKPSPKKDMLIGLRDNAEAFSELYEPLYLLSKGNGGRKDWIFNSFDRIVNALEGQDAFKAVFKKNFGKLVSKPMAAVSEKKAAKLDKKRTKKCAKAAKKLLKLMIKAGIVRDGALTVTADETTAEYYDTVGNASLVTNGKYDVIAPFWTVVIKTKEPVVKEEPAAKATEEKADEAVEAAEAVEADEAAEVAEVAEVAEEAKDKKALKKEKKAEKKASKKDKKAQKKAKKTEAEFTIKEEIRFLCKGAVK